MQIDDERFEKVKNEIKAFYSDIKKVKCPYLGLDINFNSEGFEHLLARSWNRGRSIKEQYIRLRLVPRVVDILKKVTTLQEYDERRMFVRRKINSRWEKRMEVISYYVFIVLLRKYNVRFKIIIKQIAGGEPFFWSVYPSWRVEKDNEGTNRKILYSGNLEED